MPDTPVPGKVTISAHDILISDWTFFEPGAVAAREYALQWAIDRLLTDRDRMREVLETHHGVVAHHGVAIPNEAPNTAFVDNTFKEPKDAD